MNCIGTTSAPAFSRAHLTPSDCTYILIRPITYSDEHIVSALIDDHHTVQLEVGLPDQPPYAIEFFDTAEAAIGTVLDLKAKSPHLRLWYQGSEIVTEFCSWLSLAQAFVRQDEDWWVVEQVAGRTLSPDDAAVISVSANRPTIAAAIKQVL
jgi:hypothetical protein